MGADLVNVDSSAENEFLKNSTRNLNMRSIWLGLRRNWDNRFYWLDGSRQQYSNWLPNEPNHFGGEEYCSEAVHGGWNDVSCNRRGRRKSYVCEKRMFS